MAALSTAPPPPDLDSEARLTEQLARLPDDRFRAVLSGVHQRRKLNNGTSHKPPPPAATETPKPLPLPVLPPIQQQQQPAANVPVRTPLLGSIFKKRLMARILLEVSFCKRTKRTSYPAFLAAYPRISFAGMRLGTIMQRILDGADVALSVLNAGQRAAAVRLRNGESICLQAPGGSGKSFLIHWYGRQLDKQNTRFCAAAMTVVAAALIGGQTLHRLLRLGLAKQPTETYAQNTAKGLADYRRQVAHHRHSVTQLERVTALLADYARRHSATPDPTIEPELKLLSVDRDKWQRMAHLHEIDVLYHPYAAVSNTNVFIIDEYELLHVTMFEKVMACLDVITKQNPSNKQQILFTGDLFQACPINPAPTLRDATAHPHLEEEYQSNRELLVDSDAWRARNIPMIYLDVNERQRNPEDAKILTPIRLGLLSPCVRRFLDDRTMDSHKFKRREKARQLDAELNGTRFRPVAVLTGTREAAAGYNQEVMCSVPGREMRFPMQVFYVVQDLDTKTVWHRLIRLGDQPYNYERIAGDAHLNNPNDRRHPLRADMRARVEHELSTYLKSRSQSDSVVVVREGAPIAFSRNDSRQPCVRNNDPAFVTSVEGALPPAQVYETVYPPSANEYIRLCPGPPGDMLAGNSLGIELDDGKDTAAADEDNRHVHRIVRSVDVLPLHVGELLRPQEELTEYLLVRQFPIKGRASTIDKVVGCELKTVAIDGVSLTSRQSYGLFYVAASRVYSLENVQLLNITTEHIAARASAIRYLRPTLPYFRTLTDAQFEAVMLKGTIVPPVRRRPGATAREDDDGPELLDAAGNPVSSASIISDELRYPDALFRLVLDQDIAP